MTPKMTDAIWTKAKPPQANNTMALKHCVILHDTLPIVHASLSGVSSVATTKELESEEVMKNRHIVTNTIADINKYAKWLVVMFSIKTNKELVMSFCIAGNIKSFISVPIVPYTPNHNMVISEGIIKTPRINSLMLLPFDILATNTETKAAHAAYHI